VDERTEITSPTTPAGTAALPPAPPAEKTGVPAIARRRALRWGFLAVFLAGALAALVGYWNGSAQRQTSQASLVRQVAQEQFDLALADLQAGHHELARQRLEYVINLDPSFPGAAERLAEALLALNRTDPTSAPVGTPTPDLAPVQEIFDRASAAFGEANWTLTIDSLLALRSKDPDFRAVEVDGMLYASLRNRGLERIQSREIEQGMYDLSRAARFGPLDRDAVSWRVSAGYYLLANSYFGANWAQAALYFGEVCVADIWDSCFRLGVSAQMYGDQLASIDQFCEASEQYEASLLAWPNATLEPTATEALERCEDDDEPEEPPAPSETPTATETPEGG
jgi:tetratricopeptide (TPR) repeat protein